MLAVVVEVVALALLYSCSETCWRSRLESHLRCSMYVELVAAVVMVVVV